MRHSDVATHGKIRMLARLAIFPFFLVAFPSQSQADFVLHHWEDHYEPSHGIALEGNLLYYSSTQNFDATGNAVTPAGISSATLSDYYRLGVDVLGQFGLFDHFSLFGRVSWARFQVDDSAASSTSYGLADQTVGGDYRVLDLPAITMDLQIQADLPAYSNSTDQASNSPFQGDGSVDLSFGGFLSLPLSQTRTRLFSLLGGLGYTVRSSHYSAAVPWDITASYAPKPATTGFLVAASALGSMSMKTDSSTPSLQYNGFLTGSGGSFITNAVNPSLVVLSGQVGYQLASGNQILAALERSVWGQDSPIGINAIFGFRMNLGGPESDASHGQSDRGLEEYTLDSKVVRANDRLNLVKIDKGSDDGVAVGQVFDVFSVNEEGSIEGAVARCRVTSVKSDEAALAIIEYFKEVWINPGFVAKRLAQ